MIFEPVDNLDEKMKEFYELQAIQNRRRMLFLDDRTKRIEAARKQYTQQYDVTFVHNTKECLRYLCRQQWDILSLDHDLNGDDFQDPSDTSSGMEVVRHMIGWMDQYSKPEVWVHSSNLFAATHMLGLLKQEGFKAYYRKFVYEDEKTFSNAKISREPVVVEDKWDFHHFGLCNSCNKFEIDTLLNKKGQCHECYKREMIQCA